MSFEIDRNKQTEPSVYDMTRAAIRLLHDGNPKGFFVFIENENVDTASHLSDIASVIPIIGSSIGPRDSPTNSIRNIPATR